MFDPTTKKLMEMENLSPSQRVALIGMYNHSCISLRYLDELEDGTMTFDEVWERNIVTIEHMVTTVKALRPKET